MEHKHVHYTQSVTFKRITGSYRIRKNILVLRRLSNVDLFNHGVTGGDGTPQTRVCPFSTHIL